MRKIMLNGQWELAEAGNDRLCEVQVPGSVLSGLYGAGKIEDPFYRTNEDVTRELFRKDYEFSRTFVAAEDILKEEKIILVCEGLDTLADIYINGQKAGSADNMHRTWKLDVKEFLHSGENQIRIVFRSVFKYIEAYEYEDNKEIHYVPCGGMKGNQLIRKAHCMFGWDWGPQTIDAGIFRDIYLEAYSHPRIEDVKITQVHGDNAVDVCTTVAVSGDAVDKCQVRVTIQEDAESVCGHRTGANDRKTEAHVCKVGETVSVNNNPAVLTSSIHNPKLWWPNGVGEQPLYEVNVTLAKDGQPVDRWTRKIGLRTMTMDIHPDEWGESFAHQVNGKDIFAMGADYIPEDHLLGRVTPETTRKLLEQCKAANFNAVRVWGGGYYPEDWFYDLCDELGLMVWQDFMFACAVYDLTPDFEANIREEFIDNVKRLRHHASLGLWCGNNEMEMFVKQGEWVTKPSEVRDYLFMYERVIPEILKKYDPETFYWPASPSSGGCFDDPSDPNRGDVHYWDVWHGNKPFSDYRNYYFRYASEFGFQSFPSFETIKTFTDDPADWNIFSYVMEKHQRNAGANGKILNYLQQTFRYPTEFTTLLYASQMLQAEAIKYGVEHFRRNRGRCMGAIYWQLNDCWPVASWASVDYEGRWKALHYYAKRFFAPVMVSCEEQNWMTAEANMNREHFVYEKSIRLNVTNETLEDKKVLVKWALRNADASVVKAEEREVTVQALSSVWLDKEEYPDVDVFGQYVSYEAWEGDTCISEGSVIFSYPKYFHYLDPQLSYRIEGDEIVVSAKAYAKGVEILNASEDLILSDNYFDMSAGEKRVKILGKASRKVEDPADWENQVKEQLADGLKLRSVYDIR